MQNKIINILLADDDEADRFIFIEAFAELKMKSNVQTVKNGVELMNWLEDDQQQLPHILFLDLNMPKKNGIQCLKEIRSSQKLKELCVVIYSTSNSSKDIEESFLNGANIYIHKPADYVVLKSVLEKAVSTASQYQGERMNRENFILKI
jgi:CheY-like chemotaxis protein